MRDVIKPLRGAYVSALSGITVPVYDGFAPDTGVPDTYVIISTQTNDERRNKCGSDYAPTILLDIVHRDTNHGGSRFCDDVANQILQVITETTLSVSGFSLYDTSLVGDNTLTEFSQTLKVYRRLLRFQHLLKEN